MNVALLPDLHVERYAILQHRECEAIEKARPVYYVS
jgi:hypothetical protein